MSQIIVNSSDQNDLATVKEANNQGSDVNLDSPVHVTEKETITIIKIPEKEIKDDQNVLDSAINHADKELTSSKDRYEMIKDDDEIEDDPDPHNELLISTKGRLSLDDFNTCAVSEAYDTDQGLVKDLDQDLIQVEPEKEKPRPPTLSDNFDEISSYTMPILESPLPGPVLLPVFNLVEENKSEGLEPTLEFIPGKLQ